MNEQLRERIRRKLETLSDERGYQVLDYVEFLESKYAERTAQSPNILQRFAEGVEDSLRAGRVSATTIAETMKYMNKAMNVLGDVAAAGKSVAADVVNVVNSQTTRPSAPTSTSPSTTAPSTQSNGGAEPSRTSDPEGGAGK